MGTGVLGHSDFRLTYCSKNKSSGALGHGGVFVVPFEGDSFHSKEKDLKPQWLQGLVVQVIRVLEFKPAT